MEKRNLNDKIFSPINRKEMNEVVGGKKFRDYKGTFYEKIECPKECGCDGPCVISMRYFDVYEIDDKTGKRTDLGIEKDPDKA